MSRWKQKVRSEWRQQLQSPPFCHVDGVWCCKGLGRKGLFFLLSPEAIFGRRAWRDLVSLCLPAPFVARTALLTEKTSHLEPPLSSLGDINLPIRHTHPLCSFLTIFDGSLHPPSKAHFPPRLTSQRAHLLARTSTCPPPTPARIICNFPLCAAAVKCLIVMITTRGVPLTFAGLRKSPRGIRARWHNYGTSFVFVRDKSKRWQKVHPAKKKKRGGYAPTGARLKWDWHLK